MAPTTMTSLYVQVISEGHTEQGNRPVTVAKIRYRGRWGCVVGQGVDRSTPARWIVPSKNLKDPGPSKFSGVPFRLKL